MPRVGTREFAYTPAGRKAAKDYALATGQKKVDMPTARADKPKPAAKGKKK